MANEDLKQAIIDRLARQKIDGGSHRAAAEYTGKVAALLDNIKSWLADVKAAYPHAYHRTGRTGRMVYYDCAGRIAINSLLEATTLERLFDWFVWECEMTQWVRLPRCSLAAGRLMHQFVIVVEFALMGCC